MSDGGATHRGVGRVMGTKEGYGGTWRLSDREQPIPFPGAEEARRGSGLPEAREGWGLEEDQPGRS